MRPKHKNWLLLGCFSIVWTASLAQGENHNDSLSPITHIPVIEDSASVSVTADSVAVKRSFFKKFLDYFNDANKEKKNKKFDFSVIGGPHYSSDTKLGLGLVVGIITNMDLDIMGIISLDNDKTWRLFEWLNSLMTRYPLKYLKAGVG